MQKYNLVAENPESTVVSDYRAECRTEKEYQSEADLERAFIKLLTEQAYDYLPIHTETELIANLRRQLEKLNIADARRRNSQEYLPARQGQYPQQFAPGHQPIRS